MRQQLPHRHQVRFTVTRDDHQAVGMLVKENLATSAARGDHPAAAVAHGHHRDERARGGGLTEHDELGAWAAGEVEHVDPGVDAPRSVHRRGRDRVVWVAGQNFELLESRIQNSLLRRVEHGSSIAGATSSRSTYPSRGQVAVPGESARARMPTRRPRKCRPAGVYPVRQKCRKTAAEDPIGNRKLTASNGLAGAPLFGTAPRGFERDA